MKRIIILLTTLIAMVGSVFGQSDHCCNLYGQFFGPSTGIGLGFDSRFKTGGILGYSVGLAFTDISWDDSNGLDGSYSFWDVHSKGVSIPLEVNAIMGKPASKFEIGLGVTTYLVKRDEWNYKTIFFPAEEEGSWE